ncbi:MAG: glycosyltransferase family 2 protein [Phycisphaerales bacterium]
MSALIKVCVFGLDNHAYFATVRSADIRNAAREFAWEMQPTDADLGALLAKAKPHVIVTFGQVESFPSLLRTPIEVRKRWLHFPSPPPGTELAEAIMRTYVANATGDRFPHEPLVSVFTPAYLSGDRILRPYRSLLEQVYTNWEWVLYDDSPDDGATFRQLVALAKSDPRIRVFRAGEPCGQIGEVKRRCCGLARGTVLAELDHDDELTAHCLRDVVGAFRTHPEAGFVYTDCVEVSEDGKSLTYDPGWAFGYGSYRAEVYKGRAYAVTNYPGLNAKTVRHIVGVPNHLRAWRRDAYFAIGGHSADIHVCDDYELLVRTFLGTPMVHARTFGYIQYHDKVGGSNTQRQRNAEIQRLTAYFRAHYDQRIHDRLMELGVPDYIWNGGSLNWDAPLPTGRVDANLVWVPPS